MNPATQQPAIDRIKVALAYYRHNYGCATRADIERAAQRRCFHTLAEVNALTHAGFKIDCAGRAT
jgi:hypothetical protein